MNNIILYVSSYLVYNLIKNVEFDIWILGFGNKLGENMEKYNFVICVWIGI